MLCRPGKGSAIWKRRRRADEGFGGLKRLLHEGEREMGSDSSGGPDELESFGYEGECGSWYSIIFRRLNC